MTVEVPRIPSVIWKELRKKLDRMNNGEKFPNEKTAEACAMDIQRLQHEFKHSKEFHIGLAPEPGKLILTDLFPVA